MPYHGAVHLALGLQVGDDALQLDDPLILRGDARARDVAALEHAEGEEGVLGGDGFDRVQGGGRERDVVVFELK